MATEKQKEYKKKLEEFSDFRERIHEIVFEADTPEGKRFDILLLILIVLSVAIVMLETVPSLNRTYFDLFYLLEWIFTIIFTIEYITRLYCVHRPIKYATSFYGVIDLLSILPTFLSIMFAGTQSLLVIRALRLLRVFRIFKLGGFLSQSQVITDALIKSKEKIFVFLFAILLMVCVFGSVIYLVEGGSNSNFDSIPRSVYWAIVTLTTVGYGDIAPQTPFGQFLAAIIMILGYAVIAVPTGIVSGEIVSAGIASENHHLSTQTCSHCMKEGHENDADYCKFCGEQLHGAINKRFPT
jgi:voltage-gated potassium channel